MFFKTTEDHENLRMKIREFAETEVKPIAFMLYKENEFPTEAVKKLGEMGVLGIPFPKEEVILSAHVSLGSYPIFAYGTEEQKQKYLVPLAKGEKLGAFGLTEPNAGSDAGGTETTAVLEGDYYILNGGKIFLSTLSPS